MKSAFTISEEREDTQGTALRHVNTTNPSRPGSQYQIVSTKVSNHVPQNEGCLSVSEIAKPEGGVASSEKPKNVNSTTQEVKHKSTH